MSNISNLNNKEIIYVSPNKIDNRFFIKILVNEKSKLNKFTFISPLMELNIRWQDLKYQSIKFSLEPLVGPNLELYNLINSIEENAQKEIHKYFGNSTKFKSSLSEISIDDDQFLDNEFELPSKTMMSCKVLKNINAFDNTGKKINSNILNGLSLTNYKFLIEFTDIWYDTKKNMSGCNFNIVQIKYFPSPYEIDMMPENNMVYNKIPIAPPFAPPLNSFNNIENTLLTSSIEINKESLNKPAFLINNNMLKNALGSLKKAI
jgi:hypothetical protein